MAIYHCSCNVISRSSGRSSVGASAYRSGEKLINERDGLIHDYTHKSGVVYSEVLLPENAIVKFGEVPKEEVENFKNSKEFLNTKNQEISLKKFENHFIRERLWNEVESVEKAQNSRLAREYEIALPKELTTEQQIELTKNIAQIYFVSEGQCVDIAIHDKKDGNPHAHIMTTIRPLNENMEWENKSEKLYLCKNAKGEEKAFTSKELEKETTSEWQKQYHYSKNGNPKEKKLYLTQYEKKSNPKYKEYERIKGDKYPKSEKYGKVNPMMERWNSEEFLRSVREGVSDEINLSLTQYGHEERVDHRSYQEQGIDKIPTKHIGKAQQEMKERIESGKMKPIQWEYDKTEINREIRTANEQIKALNSQIKEITVKRINVQTDMQIQSVHNEMQMYKGVIMQADKEQLESVQKTIHSFDKKMEKIKESGAYKGQEIVISAEKRIYIPKMEHEYNKYKKLRSDIVGFSEERIKELTESINKNLQEIREKELKIQTIKESKGEKRDGQEIKEVDLETRLNLIRTEYREVQTRIRESEKIENRPRITNEYDIAYNNAERCLEEIEKNRAIYNKAKDKKENLNFLQRAERKSCEGTMKQAKENIDKHMNTLNKLGIKDLSQASEKMNEFRLNDKRERQTIATFYNTKEKLIVKGRELEEKFEEIKAMLPKERQESIEKLQGKQLEAKENTQSMDKWKDQVTNPSQAISNLKVYEKSVQGKVEKSLQERPKDKGRGYGE